MTYHLQITGIQSLMLSMSVESHPMPEDFWVIDQYTPSKLQSLHYSRSSQWNEHIEKGCVNKLRST